MGNCFHLLGFGVVFVTSSPHCKGVIRWTNGNSFEGEFNNNSKCGFGVYRWSDGATYSGTWEADDRCGSAITVWANGMS
jgi:hypothetical protein